MAHGHTYACGKKRKSIKEKKGNGNNNKKEMWGLDEPTTIKHKPQQEAHMRPGIQALIVCVCTLAYVAYASSPPAAVASRKLAAADGTLSDSDITWYPKSQPDFDPDREYTLVYVHAGLRSDGAGPDILREQLEHIRTSKLWEKMDFIFIGVLGEWHASACSFAN
jgi:hypothetical protein